MNIELMSIPQILAGTFILIIFTTTAVLFYKLYLSPNRDKEKPTMSDLDKGIIREFAEGNEKLRDRAIEIHRRYIPTLGVRGTSEQCFMSEVDHPLPDHGLRNMYRLLLLENNDD